MNANDAAKVFDTILSAPGMSENVKMELKISRKKALLLSSVITRGLSVKDDGKPSLLDVVSGEELAELNAISEECLQKAGLTELNEKLQLLSGK